MASPRFVVFALVAWAALAAAPGLRAADVSYYSVGKGILFTQTNAGTPLVKSGYPYLFRATVVAVPGGLASAMLQWPFGPRGLFQNFAGAPFTYTDRLASQDLLDLFYPDDDYNVTMATTHDGTRAGLLSLSGDNYPEVPRVSNYNLAQGINPSNAFTLRWSVFVGGTSNDFVFAQLDAATGAVFRTASTPGAAGSLNGTNTLVVIPADTLAPGRAYAGRLIFAKTVAFNAVSYPGVSGAATYFTQTDFFVATTPTNEPVRPQVVSVSPPHGVVNVPLNAPFALNFSEPMRKNLSLFISGTTANPALAWSPDGLTLVATPAPNWPPNSTIGFVLNPSDNILFFGDLDRNPVGMDVAFQFVTGTNVVAPSAPTFREPRVLPNGRFDLKLLGESNRTYAAQASVDLTHWVSLGTNIAFGGTATFADTNAPGLPWRFYRGVAR